MGCVVFELTDLLRHEQRTEREAQSGWKESDRISECPFIHTASLARERWEKQLHSHQASPTGWDILGNQDTFASGTVSDVGDAAGFAVASDSVRLRLKIDQAELECGLVLMDFPVAADLGDRSIREWFFWRTVTIEAAFESNSQHADS